MFSQHSFPGNIRAVPAIVSLLLFGACNLGANDDESHQYETVKAFPNLDFERLVYFGMAPDGTDRIFVMEQEGRVSWFENRGDIGQDEVELALDITDKVRSPVSEVPENKGGNEEGLLGLAFHPEFAENRIVFLHYSATNPPGADEKQRGVISRFRMDEQRERIDRESEEVILEFDQFAGNHNGGMLEFGPDGYLYIGLGDGGGGGDPRKNGQNLGTLLGSILRIDVDREEDGLKYAIPSDNPFVGRDGAREEIYAYGLRNPWRFSFDPDNADLWVGDVCQNAWEKIYLVKKGHNYGWSYLEGTHEKDGIPEGVDPASFTPPIVEHPHSKTRSITGGYVYRGSRLPELREAYIYGDYVTGLMFALWYDREAGEVVRHEEIARTPAISSFGVDRDGEIFIVSLDGAIQQLERR